MSNNLHDTREEWLQAATAALRPSFTINGAELPQAIRVSCALPSNARRSGAIGECFADTASSDKHYEIFISPTLAEPTRVLDVLIHELCHTTKGAFNHGTAFQRIASDMLLVPMSNSSKPWKATGQALTFIEAYHSIIQALGEYPHGELSLSTRKVQTTRMLKATCPACDYTVRLTAKWAFDPHGNPRLPTCPCGSHFTL